MRLDEERTAPMVSYFKLSNNIADEAEDEELFLIELIAVVELPFFYEGHSTNFIKLTIDRSLGLVSYGLEVLKELTHKALEPLVAPVEVAVGDTFFFGNVEEFPEVVVEVAE